MEDFKPIKQVRVSAEIAEQLKQAILLGRFKAGDKLPSERLLAESFQVSRLSIREAIRTLENFGFVSTRHGVNGGVYVTDLTFENLVNAFLHLFQSGKASFRQLQQVRAIVEPEVAKLAAAAATPATVERLQAAYTAEGNLFSSLSERFQAVAAVHLILAEMCGNPFLEGIVRSALILTSHHVTITDLNGEQYHPHEMHEPIVRAVSAGDAKAAHSAMKKHVIEFGTVLLRMEKAYSKLARHSPDAKGDL